MFSGNTGNTQDYRTLLVAKITAMTRPTEGPLAGRPVYDWIEQQISMTGSDEDVPSPRRGTYTSGLDFDNALVDVNNADIPIGTYVWVRMKGSVRGATIYETMWAANITTTPSYCRTLLAALRTTECVLLTSEGGAGTYPFSVTGVWDAGESGWVATEQITTGDGLTTVTLVRGTGYYYLKFVGQTTTWYGEDIDCTDGGRVFAADGDPTDTTASCGDHTFLTTASCTICPDVCAGWYCLSNLGTVAYAATCGDLAALEELDAGTAGPGTGAECLGVDPATTPTTLTFALSTSSPVAAPWVNGYTGTMTRPSDIYAHWDTVPPGAANILAMECRGDYYMLLLYGYVSGCPDSPTGQGGGYLLPVASSVTPFGLVFEVAVCYFALTGPVPPANANDTVTIVISEV